MRIFSPNSKGSGGTMRGFDNNSKLMLLLIFGFIFTAACLGGSPGRTYKAGLPNVPGLMYRNSDGSPGGFPCEMLNCAARDEGIGLEWIDGSWSELFDKLKKGEIDVLPGTQVSAEREKIFDFLDYSLYAMWSEVYVRQGVKIHSPYDLVGKGIGLVRDDNNAAGFLDFIGKLRISFNTIWFDSHQEALTALSEGKVFAAVGPALSSTNHQLFHIGSSGIYTNPTNLNIAFPKGKNIELQQALNRRMAKYKLDPESIYHRLFKRYGLYDTFVKHHLIPEWLMPLLSGAALLSLIAIIFVFLLRRQIKARTRALVVSRQSLAAGADTLNVMFDHAAVILMLVTIDGTVEKINRLGRFFCSNNSDISPGLSLAEVIGFAEASNHGEGKNNLRKDCPICQAVNGTFRDKQNRYKVKGRVDLFREGKRQRLHLLISTVYLIIDNKEYVLLSLDDVTAEKHAIEEKIFSETRFRDIVESVSDWIWEVDVKIRYTFCSENIRGELGYSAQEIYGRTPFSLMSSEDGRRARAMFECAFETRMPIKDYESWFITKENDRVCLLVNGTPMYDAEGGFIGYRGACRNVTASTMTKLELEKAKKEAEKANIAKREFLADMSHEIRNPINGIIGMSCLLADTNLTEEQRQYLETIRSCSSSLLQLISDILDMSRIEAGKLELQKVSFNLSELLEGLMSAMALRVHAKGLELICDCDATVPLLLRGDPVRLRQILANLVDNAVKFTDGGEIELKIGLKAATATDAVIRFEVRDTGIGIPDEQRDTIFEKFTQINPLANENHGGTGLGLTIARQLVTMMQGNIGVESRSGHGSTFRFTVRLEKQLQAGPAITPAKGLEGTRILIVDDNDTNGKFMAAKLSGLGMGAVAVGSGPAALTELARASDGGDPFRIAVIDTHMPDMDGVTLGKAIRSDRRFDEVGLVMMEALGRPGILPSSDGGVAAVVLKKPVSDRALADLLSFATSSPVGGDAGNIAAAPPEPPSVNSARTGARVLVVEDNITNQLVLKGILKKLGIAVDIAVDGIEALNVLKSNYYDLVFMDIQMPLMDGREATRRIRTDRTAEYRRDIPIVAITAHAMEEDKARCLEAGMDDYISKPFYPQEVLKMLDKWLKRSSPNGVCREQEEVLA